MKKTLIKFLFAPALFAAFSPTIALSSCATISQWQIPITTGNNINTDPSLANLVIDHRGETNLDKFFVDDYAPDAYSYSSSLSNDVLHSFCQPENPENSTENLPKQYYSVTSNSIPIVNNTDKDNPKKIFKNINLLQMSNGIISVTSNLARLYAYLLTYQSRSEFLDINKITKLYGVDASKFADLYEPKGSTKNLNFFEFNYSLNNLLTEGRSTIKFDVSDLEFKFKNFSYDGIPFAYGPIANSDIEQNFVGYIKKENPQKVGEPLSSDINKYYGYDDHVVLNTQKDGDKKIVTPTLIRPIPIPISQIEMYETFYNSSSAKSFLPNDWTITDKNIVNNEIAKSNAWKSFKKYTNSAPEVQNISWKVNCSQNNSKNINANFNWPANSDSIFNMYKNALGYSDFIVLANYSIASETPVDKDKPGRTDRAMIFSGISGVYPAFFFENNDAFVKTDIISPSLDSSDKDVKIQDKYFVNKVYLDKQLKKLNNALIQHNLTEDIQKLIKYSFMKSNGTDWDFNLEDIISPLF